MLVDVPNREGVLGVWLAPWEYEALVARDREHEAALRDEEERHNVTEAVRKRTEEALAGSQAEVARLTEERDALRGHCDLALVGEGRARHALDAARAEVARLRSIVWAVGVALREARPRDHSP